MWVNDAQLAAVLSADVAGAIQEDAFRSLSAKHTEEVLQWGSLMVPYSGAIGSIVVGGAYESAYWGPLIQREYRVGMSYMAAAGYDVRQAPEAIRQIQEWHAADDEARGKEPPKLAGYLEFIYATEYAKGRLERQTTWRAGIWPTARPASNSRS
jgi:hypothetical protein